MSNKKLPVLTTIQNFITVEDEKKFWEILYSQAVGAGGKPPCVKSASILAPFLKPKYANITYANNLSERQILKDCSTTKEKIDKITDLVLCGKISYEKANNMVELITKTEKLKSIMQDDDEINNTILIYPDEREI